MENLSYEERRLALIKEINTAFDGVSREDGVTFHETRVIDDGGSPEEQAKARELDTEERWQDVPEKLLSSRGAVLNFLDMKGFRYYVPAYIVCYLRGTDSSNSAADDIVVVLNAASIDGRLSNFALTRFKVFTLEQSQAIAHFLVFEAEREAAEWAEWEQEILSTTSQVPIWPGESPYNQAQWALDSYWGQFV